MSTFFKRLLNKSFSIELKDALDYPTSEKICEVIEAHCNKSKDKLQFIDKTNPVTFSLDGTKYEAKVNMARGGYYILCTEA
ncbi:DUF4318 domain-containing protein [Clostridium paridis]|uniref:DUF4318 domain-containing protein n=1 Tax=Clostridium paridis TaxID=2803863 RepID=A0A937K5Z0_9CLOT|nr:DUF4318 domain-containing protein [Clostridium paridis]MBL4933644.1 DUF4318 domain-containing protein [Clostridium paridis]